MREKFELEYTLNSSPRLLFNRLSTPEGMAEWFAENVTVDKDQFTFSWGKTELQARLSALKENKFVRFEWVGREDEETNYFEFRINIDELTSEVALVITDFTESDEIEDAKSLWDTQITDLKRVLGI